MTTEGSVRRAPWWQTEVLYQIYPRSFADSNGDGIGDLQGIVDRLDYLQWLGVGGLWINPIMPSPNADWGYDVADYCEVDPDYGTLEDADRLVKEAASRGIKIVFDIVPNHTSDRHEWFQNALKSRDSRHRDYYVWADPKPDGSPPNNWLSVFGGGAAWAYHEPTGQYYLHNFLAQQPDLNWWNDDVRKEFDHILRFWFDRGVAGFRIDVAHALIKDRALRDNLPTPDDVHPQQKHLAQLQTYSMNRPEVHDVFRRWRQICETYDPARVLIGETFVYDIQQLVSYYGSGTDELNLAFNFPFALSGFDGNSLKEVVRATEAALPPEAWPVWMASNHDVGRVTTRWCGEDEAKARLVTMLLLTLRGTPFIYYGDEIAMTEPGIPQDRVRDPVGHQRSNGGFRRGRDGCRTPMQWSSEEGAGFTRPPATPWLPLGDQATRNVAAQRDDPDSYLSFVRALIGLRKRSSDLAVGSYEELDSPEGTWLFRRDGTTVALNMSDEPAVAEVAPGTVLLTTDGRGGDAVEGTLELSPWKGAVVTQP